MTCWTLRMEGLVVPVVTDVLVTPSPVVTEFCDGDSLEFDCEYVEPQSSSFSTKRSLDWAITQEEMRYEGSPLKSASALQKKNDAAHATTKLVYVNCRRTQCGKRK